MLPPKMKQRFLSTMTGLLPGKLYRQFQCVHNANDIDVDDVHAWFGWRGR